MVIPCNRGPLAWGIDAVGRGNRRTVIQPIRKAERATGLKKSHSERRLGHSVAYSLRTVPRI